MVPTSSAGAGLSFGQSICGQHKIENQVNIQPYRKYETLGFSPVLDSRGKLDPPPFPLKISDFGISSVLDSATKWKICLPQNMGFHQFCNQEQALRDTKIWMCSGWSVFIVLQDRLHEVIKAGTETKLGKRGHAPPPPPESKSEIPEFLDKSVMCWLDFKFKSMSSIFSSSSIVAFVQT